jgi:hypothetical protein
MNVQKVSHWVFIATCVVLTLVALGKHVGRTPPRTSAREAKVRGILIESAQVLAVGQYDVTILVAVSPGCSFCTASMPFYGTLLAAARTSRHRTQVVFGSRAPVPDLRAYLASSHVNPDKVIFVPVEIPLEGTPTVFVIASSGEIRDAWIGRLDAEQEKALLRLVTSRTTS